MSWSGAPQWLPRRRPRDPKPASNVGGLDSFELSPAKPNRAARHRVTSGGSVLGIGQRRISSGDFTGTDSEMDVELGLPKFGNDLVVPVESRVYEVVVPRPVYDDAPLGWDEMHEKATDENLATMNGFDDEEWMFE